MTCFCYFVRFTETEIFEHAPEYFIILTCSISHCVLTRDLCYFAGAADQISELDYTIYDNDDLNALALECIQTTSLGGDMSAIY